MTTTTSERTTATGTNAISQSLDQLCVNTIRTLTIDLPFVAFVPRDDSHRR